MRDSFPAKAARAAGRWARSWPRWVQVVVGLFVVVALLSSTSSDDAETVTADATAPDGEVSSAERRTTTTERQTTTTIERTTTTTAPASPEGGSRASTAEVADAPVDDGVARDAVSPDDLALLDALAVAVEAEMGSYERSLFPHWDDADGDGCDTRCEVLTSQRLPDGGWFSEWDGATEYDSSQVHVDHVVALAEAWRSGAHAWSPDRRDEFADDRANLLAVTASSNVRKSDRDAATWFPSRHEANCLWARTVVLVKTSWQLSVDPAEKDALRNLLASCGAAPPSTTTTVPPSPPPTPAQPVATPAGGDCTPGYDPCLPPASDYDCAGGSGNGPEYTGRVLVDHAHGDPYGLDSDGDGVGCE